MLGTNAAFYMHGIKNKYHPDPHPPLQCEEASNLPSFLTTATPASQNEAWARLNNDPLLMVKIHKMSCEQGPLTQVA